MPTTDDKREILDFLYSEQESYYRGDFEAFADHWHHGPETRRLISGPQVGTRVHIGWDELCQKFQEGFRQYPQDFDARKLLRWDNIQIMTSGDMAWVTYDQVALESVPQMHVSRFAHETKILRRCAGQWKIVCLIGVIPGLGREDVPIIELGPDGQVLRINDLADTRLGAHQGLTISGNKPRAKNRAYDPGLQSAIQAGRRRLATNLPRGYQQDAPGVIALGEDPTGKPLFCWVSLEQERILLSFEDDVLMRSRLEAATRSYALSPAQLELAQLLAGGRDIAAAARELGVSANTVRTQVRRMFEKTDTHSQASLISRLLNAQSPT